MTDSMESKVPSALSEIMREFSAADDREKLELLLEFSDSLPDPPERLIDEMEQVEECQSPVAIHAESDDGQMHFYFAPPSTVRRSEGR